MIVYNIRIEIDKIEVDERYFSFVYRVTDGDNNLIKAGEYDSDHAWAGEEDLFKKHLENSGALKLVYEQL